MAKVRVTVSGAVSAGVVTSLLVAERVPFSATPLSDGRWAVEAEVSGALLARIEAHGSAPITVEDLASGERSTVSVPKAVRVAAAAEAPPQAAVEPGPAPAPESEAPPSQFEDEVVDRFDFQADSEKAAKNKATRLALERLGARPYPGVSWQPWKQEGGANLFMRPGYRGNRDGFMVVGVASDGACFLGWRRRKG